MKILEYNDVDPLQVLHLTLLALDFSLTPERAAHIRRTDPRPFPCFTVNAVEDDMVLGQVGVFRLPMISTEGREDVGGVWAVSTHPQHAGRGVASVLLEEAHTRMRDAGLRFSTLGTSRSGVAYRLYQKFGYVDMNVWATALARWEVAHQPTRLRAQPTDRGGFDFVETIFQDLAGDYLGFAWRHTPFIRLRDKVKVEDIWVVWENRAPVGFVFANKNELLLKVNIQILRADIDAAEVVAAVASQIKASYVQVTLSRPADIASLRCAGWQVAHPNWEAFMVKPLLPELTGDDARRLFGIGTDRFLVSWLDVT
ncbi:MAG: GNAT family N-acetyltransferase [Anaerolineales bacterium]|nr:GNAT family N-acetyltransferase [Anaerolineales bacterium]